MPKKKAATTEKLPFKINEAKRYFCDRAFLPFNDEYFLLAVQSGPVVVGEYVFTPKHMKRFLERLQLQIADYEKKFGVINASLSDVK